VKLWMLGAVAFALLSLFTLWQRSELRATRIELRQTSDALAEAELREEAAREAWVVAMAHAQRLARDRAEAIRVEDDVTTREGADAPASDFLRGLHGDLERLR
jgi:hypothetical protein